MYGDSIPHPVQGLRIFRQAANDHSVNTSTWVSLAINRLNWEEESVNTAVKNAALNKLYSLETVTPQAGDIVFFDAPVQSEGKIQLDLTKISLNKLRALRMWRSSCMWMKKVVLQRWLKQVAMV